MSCRAALPGVLLIGLAASACGGGGAPAPAAQTTALGEGMNVLVITIDSLRSRSLATYGYERSTMPSLEAWAAEAVVFPHAYATSAWTFPGVGSLFTGLYPGRHGLDGRERELRNVPTLHGILAAAGYRVPTVAHYPGTPWFRVIDLEPRWENPQTGKRGDLVQWLGSIEARERPFIAWDHWRGSHLPYNPPSPYDTVFGAGADTAAADLVRSYVVIPAAIQAFGPNDRGPVIDQYDATLRWTDGRWGEVQAALEANGLADNTIVVVTADHGEELLEHGLVGHASTTMYAQLFEEVLQIPLMIRVPGATLRPPQCRVSQVDVLPTLLALLGLPIPPDLDGRDLSATMRGAPCPEVPIYAESIQGGFQARGESARTFVWAVRDGDQKLILTRSDEGESRQLYALNDDPEERQDRAAVESETVGRLDALLTALIHRSGGDSYWRDRADAEAFTGRMPTEVLAAPEILDPLDGATLEFESSEGVVAGSWSGSPAASYVIEYDVGEGANRTRGTFEIEGTRYEFGPVPREVWHNLSQFNPWLLRLWHKAAPDKKSPWASFTIAPPATFSPQRP